MDIATIRTRDNKTVFLRDAQWKHIKYRHPEMANRLIDIEETVRNPTKTVRYSDRTTKFYRFIKSDKNYIMVATKLLNGEGFIITAYLTKKSE